MAEEEAPSGHGRRLVVLDDEPVLADMMADLARRLGWRAAAATSAPDFLRELEDPADIVVIDLLVPGIDGIEMLRRIADSGARPAVILVSGVDERVLAAAGQTATELGLRVLGLLSKPFPPEALRRLIGALDLATVPAEALQDAVTDRQRMLRAFADGELAMQYQPIIDLRTGAWTGAEALARWRQPDGVVLTPSAFLPLVDDRLTAGALTDTVIRAAAADWPAVTAAAGHPVRLSVNIHPLALDDVALPDTVSDVFGAQGIGPSDIVLEVTEAARDSRASGIGAATRLRMRGVGLSIDDFGVGHSSLERLSRMPFTELKIDRGFTADVAHSAWAQAIVSQSLGLARALGLHAVAEGVETVEALQWLRAAGCDAAQGYLVARPMWPGDLAAWEQAWYASPAFAACWGAAAA
jgi:EAL domain-containing protein (putative c-di-GMP-specific phosphodiesterase class I)/AmiR/NasT family two-component response regulator